MQTSWSAAQNATKTCRQILRELLKTFIIIIIIITHTDYVDRRG